MPPPARTHALAATLSTQRGPHSSGRRAPFSRRRQATARASRPSASLATVPFSKSGFGVCLGAPLWRYPGSDLRDLDRVAARSSSLRAAFQPGIDGLHGRRQGCGCCHDRRSSRQGWTDPARRARKGRGLLPATGGIAPRREGIAPRPTASTAPDHGRLETRSGPNMPIDRGGRRGHPGRGRSNRPRTSVIAARRGSAPAREGNCSRGPSAAEPTV